MEVLILLALGLWLVLAVRSTVRHKGGCGCSGGCSGNCAGCSVHKK